MNVSSISPTAITSGSRLIPADAHRFSDVFEQAARRELQPVASTREDEAREAAKAMVASAFLVPILSSMRDTTFAAGPFAPTTAEKRFGPLIDQQLADQVMSGTNFALVEAVVQRITQSGTEA